MKEGRGTEGDAGGGRGRGCGVTIHGVEEERLNCVRVFTHTFFSFPSFFRGGEREFSVWIEEGHIFRVNYSRKFFYGLDTRSDLFSLQNLVSKIAKHLVSIRSVFT